jgi:A/G-specific adenine glycosylase
VIPYYNRFLARFPDLEALAGAAEGEILALWSGLGYYSRARNLHKAARQMVEKHKEFPKELKAILALPGIGRYTAGAICSIAFNQTKPVVDGNIRRVISRLHGIQKRVSENYFWDQMSAWIPERQSSAFNQAMMEMGALVCVPFQPRCSLCPVAGLCTARRLSIQSRIPGAKARQTIKHIQIVILVLEHKSRILLTSAHKLQLIPGNWGLPCRQISDCESPEDVASILCRRITGRAIPLSSCTRIHHSISRYRILAYAFYGKPHFSKPHPQSSSKYCWSPCSQNTIKLTSSLFRKVLQKYEELRLKEK